MPAYVYRARDVDGNENRGTIATASEEEARRVLRNRGLLVTEVHPEHQGVIARIARAFHKQDSPGRSRQ